MEAEEAMPFLLQLGVAWDLYSMSPRGKKVVIDYHHSPTATARCHRSEWWDVAEREKEDTNG
jgi:hypothetical protein